MNTPAFPIVPSVDASGRIGIGLPDFDPGMSLRDYFAGHALAGFIASLPQGVEPSEVRTGMARDCYAIADAMIEARGAA
ncbi:hypothetical protein [Lysobacter sp. ESA13C]|uniref:hypothetical protein n=1 Tax=Lysobacter sp. ESA13C TaxID=2862676 RepID=UPI001CBCA10F|nr:hypothetical protein [Lysobacter sp. ESA13C]